MRNGGRIVPESAEGQAVVRADRVIHLGIELRRIRAGVPLRNVIVDVARNIGLRVIRVNRAGDRIEARGRNSIAGEGGVAGQRIDNGLRLSGRGPGAREIPRQHLRIGHHAARRDAGNGAQRLPAKEKKSLVFSVVNRTTGPFTVAPN